MEEVIDGKVQGKRGARITRKWEPKTWKPEYEAMIALSCTGLSNEEVAKRFGYDKQTVSNLRNTTQGKKLISLIAARVRDMNTESITERVAALQSKALERVETIIHSDDAFLEKPLAIFDRALDVLKSGILKDKSPPQHTILPGSTTNIQKAVFMQVSPEAAKQLDDGLDKANQVRMIHSGNTGVDKP